MEEKIKNLSEEEKIMLINNSSQRKIVDICLSFVHEETLMDIAKHGRTAEIAKRAFDMLENPKEETLRHIAKYGRTAEIAERAFDIIENPSEETLMDIAKYGRTYKMAERASQMLD